MKQWAVGSGQWSVVSGQWTTLLMNPDSQSPSDEQLTTDN